PVEQGRWTSDHAAIRGALVLGWTIAGGGAGPLGGRRSGNDDNARPAGIGAAGGADREALERPATATLPDNPESQRWTHRSAVAWAQGQGVGREPVCRTSYAAGQARFASDLLCGQAMPPQRHHGYPVAARER